VRPLNLARAAALLALAVLPSCSAGTSSPRSAAASPTASPTPTASATPTPAPTPTASADPCGGRLPAGSTVAVVGDSYTTGIATAGGQGAKGWPALLAQQTGWHVVLDAVVGAGYVAPGFDGVGYHGPTFVDLVKRVPAQHPDLVIVFGSLNDVGRTGAAYGRAVDGVLAAAARTGARVVVATTFWTDDSPSAELLAMRDTTRQATARVRCAAFVDPLAERWFGTAYKGLIAEDGEHPTDAGHERLAQLWRTDLQRLGIAP
jgi:lysophospholipase L1-like esterase